MNSFPFSKAEIERTIPDRFEQIVEHFPRRTAIKSERGSIYYSDLNSLANRIAHAIMTEIGVSREPIVLLFGHDPDIIPALLGILKSGNAYVALDPEIPASRNSFIINDLQSRLTITNTSNFLLSKKISRDGQKLLNIDQLDQSLPDHNPTDLSITPQTVEGIFYTSGTTGEPKGVVRSHRCLLHRIWLEANDYAINPEDNISLIHSFSFGASQTDIFNALLTGATLSLFDIKRHGLDRLIPWLMNEKISLFHAPVDLFRQFIELLKEDDFFPKLRQITPSGRLFKKDVQQIRKHIPDNCILIQRLASTETGMITRFIINRQTELRGNIIPVGYAVDDKEVSIVDESGESLGFNRVGEIAVRSMYLASGYWRRPELTADAFLPANDGTNRIFYRLGDLGRIRSDGCLELVGRKDFQIKIRGFRVEIGEIEAALLNLEIIREAVVTTQELDSGEKRLIAYFVPAIQEKVSTSQIRKLLLNKLPDYMIPSIFIPMPELPLTDRNKPDLTALPDPGRSRPELDDSFAAPVTPVEKKLAEIWSEILHIEPVGTADNFFELGGHSLLAARMIARINSSFQVNLPLRSLFDTPTIAGQALEIEKAAGNQVQTEENYLANVLNMLGYS